MFQNEAKKHGCIFNLLQICYCTLPLGLNKNLFDERLSYFQTLLDRIPQNIHRHAFATCQLMRYLTKLINEEVRLSKVLSKSQLACSDINVQLFTIMFLYSYRSSAIFLLWLIFLPIINCNILRLQCKMIAEFRIKKDGQKLENSVIETIKNVKLQQCFDSCMHNYQCKSVNFKATNIRICQLNSKSSVDIFDAVSLTADPNWDFYSPNFSDKLVSISKYRTASVC